MDPLLKASILRTLGFLLWASLSAWLFVLVEYTEIDDRQEKYHSLYSLYQFLASKYNMSLEEFNNISNIAYEALSEPKPQWTFGSAATFVLQALTTIGYGWITPQTPAGQTLCICVSLVGIPITMLTLKSVGELIAKYVNRIITKLEKRIFKISEPKHRNAKSAMILVAIMVLLIVINGLLVMHLLNWSLIEAVYYWFITYSTIGFGDYILRQPHRIKELTLNMSQNQSKNESGNAGKTTYVFFAGFFGAIYSLIALCIVSSVLNAIMASIEERKCLPRCPGCVPREISEQEDNGSQHSDAPEKRATTITHLNMERFQGFHKDNNVSLSVTELK